MADDLRGKAKTYLQQIPASPGEIQSIGPTAGKFFQLTGMNQTMLTANWSAGGIMTSCNSFVALYAASLGLVLNGRSLGQFGLDKKVESWGKGYAWVPASSGKRPKFGDIFELERLHQGVSLDVDGSTWNTVEAGQGGKSTGYDIIKRKQSPQTGGVLTHQTIKKTQEPVKGWLDIELYLNGLPTTQPMPSWLTGWWQVPWRGRIFYYFFERPGTAKWTFKKPISDALTPTTFDDTAKLTFDSAQVLTLVWSATGTVEKFRRQTDRLMVGDWNSAEPLTATRCF